MTATEKNELKGSNLTGLACKGDLLLVVWQELFSLTSYIKNGLSVYSNVFIILNADGQPVFLFDVTR